MVRRAGGARYRLSYCSRPEPFVGAANSRQSYAIVFTDQGRIDDLIARTRTFVREVAIPNEDRVEREDRVGDDLVVEMRKLGTFGWNIPRAYGGSELTTEELSLAFMELSQCSVAYRVVGAQNAGIGYRDVRAARIYEGTSQIHLLNIAKHLLRGPSPVEPS